MDKEEVYAPLMPTPTTRRPLLGLTLLMIEDSRYASEAVRLMCLRSGARIRRADCLRAARKHLQMYQPSVVMVDLGLPDGAGTDLIAEMCGSAPRPEVILGTSGDADGEHRAVMAGADGFVAKPIASLGLFQEAILAHLPVERRPPGARVVPSDRMDPDPIAYRDDMAHVAEMLEEARHSSDLDYVAQFLTGVAQIAQDHVLVNAADALARKRAAGGSAMSEAAAIAGLLQERLATRIAI